MTLINYVPDEVIIKIILPHLSTRTVLSLRLASTQVRDFFDRVANYVQGDLTLANTPAHYPTSNPSAFHNFHRFLQRHSVIQRDPTLFEQIVPHVQKATKKAGGNPDQVKDLVQFGGSQVGKVLPLLVVFDYDSKQLKPNGPLGLGACLSVAISLEEPETIHAIFLHPNVKDMALDNLGITLCINNAIETKNRLAVESLASLPGAGKVQPNFGEDSLARLLCKATCTNDAGIVQAIASIPKSGKIQVRFVVECLIKAVENDNPEIVRVLLNLPSANQLTVNNLDAAIKKAQGKNKKEIIDAIVNATPADKLAKLQSALDLQSSKDE